jgi:hypothetical protein
MYNQQWSSNIQLLKNVSPNKYRACNTRLFYVDSRGGTSWLLLVQAEMDDGLHHLEQQLLH